MGVKEKEKDDAYQDQRIALIFAEKKITRQICLKSFKFFDNDMFASNNDIILFINQFMYNLLCHPTKTYMIFHIPRIKYHTDRLICADNNKISLNLK